MKVRTRLKLRAYRKTGGPINIGNRCKSYEQGCVVCEAYRFYDERGRFPTWEEVMLFAEHTHTEMVKRKQYNLMVDEMVRPTVDPEVKKAMLNLIFQEDVK
jgi:hypothetical protein